MMKFLVVFVVIAQFWSLEGSSFNGPAIPRWNRAHQYSPRYRDQSTSYSQYELSLSFENKEQVDLEGRIVGGYSARVAHAPYQLRISSYIQNQRSYCGAVVVQLMNLQFAITAAHCLWDSSKPSNTVNAKDVRIMAGVHKLSTKSGNEQDRTTDRVLLNPQFNDNDGDHTDDIALLFFKQPFKITRFVSTIALPTGIRPDPETVVISGWGSTSTKTKPNGAGAKIPDTLQVAVIRTWNNKVCRFYTSLNVNVNWKQICVHQPGAEIGPCLGDSGGPAIGVDKSTGRWYVAGILSYYLGSCGSRSDPAVYVKVGAYLSWIWDEVKIYKYISGTP